MGSGHVVFGNFLPQEGRGVPGGPQDRKGRGEPICKEKALNTGQRRTDPSLVLIFVYLEGARVSVLLTEDTSSGDLFRIICILVW